MERRWFLKSAAGVLPAAGLRDLVLGQTAAAPVSGEAHLVGAGEDRLGETHSLGFSTILFKVLPRETLRAGESLLGPRGVPHAFAGAGEKPAHRVIAFSPAGMMEAFFREVAVANGPKMDAAVFARYEMQYVGSPLVAG